MLVGLTFGTSIWLFFSNGAKPWLVVKEGAVDTARKVFNGSDIHIINLLLTAANANRVVLSI